MLYISGSREIKQQVVVHGKTIPCTNGKLRLSHIGIKSVKEVENLGNINGLQVLDLSNNEIATLDGLEGISAASSLKKLDLSNNTITRIQHLDHLEHLEELQLDHNRIEKIEGLDNFHDLVELRLDNNLIHAVEKLGRLFSLERLTLGDNPLPEQYFQNLGIMNWHFGFLYDLEPLIQSFQDVEILEERRAYLAARVEFRGSSGTRVIYQDKDCVVLQNRFTLANSFPFFILGGGIVAAVIVGCITGNTSVLGMILFLGVLLVLVVWAVLEREVVKAGSSRPLVTVLHMNKMGRTPTITPVPIRVIDGLEIFYSWYHKGGPSGLDLWICRSDDIKRVEAYSGNRERKDLNIIRNIIDYHILDARSSGMQESGPRSVVDATTMAASAIAALENLLRAPEICDQSFKNQLRSRLLDVMAIIEWLVVLAGKQLPRHIPRIYLRVFQAFCSIVKAPVVDEGICKRLHIALATPLMQLEGMLDFKNKKSRQ